LHTNITYGQQDMFITSPARAVAKYYDDHVCLALSLSAGISPEPHAPPLPNFVHVAYMAAARSSSDRVMKSQEEGAILWVLLHTGNAL